jgi:cytochrome c-type protein NapB
MGKSKIVKDMSYDDIVKSLKGYRDGVYGDSLKSMMIGQVKGIGDKDIIKMAKAISIGLGVVTDNAIKHISDASILKYGGNYINLNIDSSSVDRIKKEDLSNKKSINENELGLRKTDLYTEDKTKARKTDYNRPTAGSSTRFERAYKDAPPMIPHSVEGLLPITKDNHQCLGCHMPDVSKSVGSTPIPPTHFTNYRPSTKLQDGYIIKDGKILGKEIFNTTDIKLIDTKKLKTLYKGRFNCTQCHAPQSKTKTNVANTFIPDFKDTRYKKHSSLADAMNEGI